MKKSLLIIASISLFWVACQADSGKGSAESRIEKLEQEVAFFKQVFGAVGVDLEKIKEQIESENKIHDIPLEDSPSIGPADAKITLVEFSDFECPACANAAGIIKKIQESNPKDVRVVFKHFPLSFHKNAPPAHAASMAAHSQGKFWEFRYALAPHFRSLTKAKFIEIAKSVGITDIKKFEEDMVLNQAKQATIKRDMDLGMKVGVRGTPSFYANGKKLKDYRPAAIEALLKSIK